MRGRRRLIFLGQLHFMRNTPGRGVDLPRGVWYAMVHACQPSSWWDASSLARDYAGTIGIQRIARKPCQRIQYP